MPAHACSEQEFASAVVKYAWTKVSGDSSGSIFASAGVNGQMLTCKDMMASTVSGVSLR